MPPEPNLVFARQLMRLGDEHDPERLRLAIPEFMAAARGQRERRQVRRLVERLLSGPDAFAESRWLDMRAAERDVISGLEWAVRRPELPSAMRRDLPIGSADWHEELMLTLAACWEAMAADAPDAAQLVADTLAARRRDRGLYERRWLEAAPDETQSERAQQLQSMRALLEGTYAAVNGDGELAQRRLAHVRRADALGLLGLAHIARELGACVRFRLGTPPGY